jgi:hypothetical protein
VPRPLLGIDTLRSNLQLAVAEWAVDRPVSDGGPGFARGGGGRGGGGGGGGDAGAVLGRTMFRTFLNIIPGGRSFPPRPRFFTIIL